MRRDRALSKDMRVGTSWCLLPSFPSFDALNSYLEERCLERLGRATNT